MDLNISKPLDSWFLCERPKEAEKNKRKNKIGLGALSQWTKKREKITFRSEYTLRNVGQVELSVAGSF